MLIRIRETGEVITDRQFRANNPSTSFPPQLTAETLDAFGADPVLEGAQPTGEPWQQVEADGVEQIEGQWFTKFKLGPSFATPAEQDAYIATWLESRKMDKLAALADRRWQAETGGIAVGGISIKTDEKSQAKVHAAWSKAKADPGFSITNWKFETGVFGTLSNAVIIVAGDAVTAHVQACFNHEATLSAAIIAAEDYETLDAIDIEDGWPS